MRNASRLRRTKLALLAAGMLVASVLLVAFGLTVWTVIDVHASVKPDWLGNSPENIRRLTASAEPNDLVFYVVGDVRGGAATLEKLLGTVSGEKPDFLVLLGDFVGDRDSLDHQLFIHEMAEQNLSFPVLLVAGNHDISPKGPFRLEDFELTYGPAQFHFTIGKCLFLFLNNAPGHYDKTGAYLRYMDQVLSERGGGVEHVFVFAHAPPMGLSPSVKSHKLHGSEQFMELARKHRVHYVFAGDHHGYWKGERDGTTYIVSGGGGARLRGRRGRFHHAVRVAVESGRISDSLFAVEHSSEGVKLLERNIVLYVWPLLTNNGLRIALTALFLLATASLLFLSARRWRRPLDPRKGRVYLLGQEMSDTPVGEPR